MHGTSEPHCPQLRPIYNCCTQYKYWLYKRNGEAGMDLNSLQVFLTVARERSFSRAAEKLYRTQPAISISAELGPQPVHGLLDRGGERVGGFVPDPFQQFLGGHDPPGPGEQVFQDGEF